MKSKPLPVDFQLLILQEEQDDLRQKHEGATRELRALKASRAAEKENVGGLLAKRWLRDEELAGASEEILDKNKELQTNVFGMRAIIADLQEEAKQNRFELAQQKERVRVAEEARERGVKNVSTAARDKVEAATMKAPRGPFLPGWRCVWFPAVSLWPIMEGLRE